MTSDCISQPEVDTRSLCQANLILSFASLENIGHSLLSFRVFSFLPVEGLIYIVRNRFENQSTELCRPVSKNIQDHRYLWIKNWANVSGTVWFQNFETSQIWSEKFQTLKIQSANFPWNHLGQNFRPLSQVGVIDYWLVLLQKTLF